MLLLLDSMAEQTQLLPPRPRHGHCREALDSASPPILFLKIQLLVDCFVDLRNDISSFITY